MTTPKQFPGYVAGIFRKAGSALLKCASYSILVFTVSGTLTASGQNVVFPDGAQFLNVMDYGATGDGRTDDTDAIRAAISHLEMNLTLYFPDGDYLISDSLNLKDKGDHGQEINRIFIQGQSLKNTTIRLADGSRPFQNREKPEPVITTKRGNESFRNRFSNFTLIVGKRNPGAIGIDMISCNGGSISNVRMLSEDRENPGVAGIYVGHGDNGPFLMRDVQIHGFRKGIHLESWFWSNIVAENIRLRGQSECGVLHEASAFSLVGLIADEPDGVPAVINRSVMSLVDADLKSTGGKAAVMNEAKLFARNVRSIGYEATVKAGEELVKGGVEERVWGPVKELFPSTRRSLNLTREVVPDVPWDTDFSRWVNVEDFGAKPDQECSDAFQAAIDHAAEEAKHTVYFPRKTNYRLGKTVRVHGSVRRIIGFGSQLMATRELSQWLNDEGTGGRLPTDEEIREPILRIEPGSPVVVIERMEIDGFQWGNTAFVEHAAPNTVVFRYGSGMTYRNTVPGGKVFLDDWTGQLLLEGNQWAQANVYEQVAFRNDGGTLLMLGLRNESCSTIGTNLNGAATEILGGVTCSHHRPWVRPSFLNVDSQMSVAAYCTGHPGFATDERHGYSRELFSGAFGRDISLFVANPLVNQSQPAAPVGRRASGPSGKWPFKIQLDWTASSDDAVGYEIRRNGERLSWTDQNSWTDEVMQDSETCDYEVRAMNGAMEISDPAKISTMTPADNAGLEIIDAVAYRQIRGERLHLTFNKPVAEGSVSKDVISISPDVEVTGVRLEKDLRTVTVETRGMTADDNVHIEVAGIHDQSKIRHVLAKRPLEVTVSNPSHGLVMELFGNKNLEGQPSWRRTDRIDQDWEDQQPLPGMQPGDLSIRWSGRVRMDRSNTYRFVRQGRGQSNLWIDGEKTDTAFLVAGRLYDLRVEYVPDGRQTQMRLLWHTPEEPDYRELAPECLYLPDGLPLRVESAQAVGDKLSVVFNQPLDADKAVQLESYAIKGSSLDSPELQPDQHTVNFRVRDLSVGTDHILRVRDLKSADGNALASDSSTFEFEALDSGTGLNAYFMDLWVKSRARTRLDPEIDFNWGMESPFPGMRVDYFRIEWEGWIIPPVTGEYTFSGETDDWDQMIPRVGGVTLFTIENWDTRRGENTSGKVRLNAGQPVRLHVFFRDQYQTAPGGNARCELYWEADGVAKQIVPTRCLYPVLD